MSWGCFILKYDDINHDITGLEFCLDWNNHGSGNFSDEIVLLYNREELSFYML